MPFFTDIPRQVDFEGEPISNLLKRSFLIADFFVVFRIEIICADIEFALHCPHDMS